MLEQQLFYYPAHSDVSITVNICCLRHITAAHQRPVRRRSFSTQVYPYMPHLTGTGICPVCHEICMLCKTITLFARQLSSLYSTAHYIIKLTSFIEKRTLNVRWLCQSLFGPCLLPNVRMCAHKRELLHLAVSSSKDSTVPTVHSFLNRSFITYDIPYQLTQHAKRSQCKMYQRITQLPTQRQLPICCTTSCAPQVAYQISLLTTAP